MRSAQRTPSWGGSSSGSRGTRVASGRGSNVPPSRRAQYLPEPSELKMIRRLKSGEYRLYSRKKDPRTGRRRNLGTFSTKAKALAHERAVQFFKRRG